MAFIDKANVGNARIAGFEKDLGLVGYDYNILLSVFYVSYSEWRLWDAIAAIHNAALSQLYLRFLPTCSPNG